MKKESVAVVLAVVFAVAPELVWGYVGPGVGLSLVGSLFGLLAAIVISIGVIMLWPVRSYMRRRKARREQGAAESIAGEDRND